MNKPDTTSGAWMSLVVFFLPTIIALAIMLLLVFIVAFQSTMDIIGKAVKRYTRKK
jgi:hypothetical protein